jgi:DNA invertase Pin-like site-specific DNA recombinase
MNRIVQKITSDIPAVPEIIPVAAYARVSSGKDAMLHSLSAQVSYYNEYIQKHSGWDFAGVYSDEALTGTKDDRAGLQRLLADCRAGKVRLIITKSISRFARNTVDLLATVRELRSIGVGVYFEEQRIDTMSGDGELMLSILASYAQEESRAVSENCKWRIREDFKNGELVNLRFMYGYRIENGVITVNEEQADVVRQIFEDYIGGMGSRKIANKLRDAGVPAFRNGLWSETRVAQLLTNEKYTGNSLLQKRFVADHLNKKLVRNFGELPQYFAEGTHTAIIDVATFETAERIRAERRVKHTRDETVKRYAFSGKILCENCGKHYIRKNAHGKIVWRCTTFEKLGKSRCAARQIPESVLETLTSEVGGTENVAQIRVPAANALVFVLRDGAEFEREWHTSRRDSWTHEMREAARQRTLQRGAK